MTDKIIVEFDREGLVNFCKDGCYYLKSKTCKKDDKSLVRCILRTIIKFDIKEQK